tara:strand:+ start:3172 stop:4122 length:951 start_codon:yes stop_codon:yes gene_type:complete
MPIKHLVLPGGGSVGIKIIGALKELHDNSIWKTDDIVSIHSVSIGGIVSVLVALKFELEDIANYVVNRPWEKAYTFNLNNLFDVFNNKGFFGTEVFVTFMKPFFDTRDISLNITLLEFYEKTNVDCCFYTTDLNTFRMKKINYQTYPDLTLMKAVHMSAAYPVLISPVFFDDNCFVDGGLSCNSPVKRCLQEYTDFKDILTIGSSKDNSDDNITTESSSLFDFIMSIVYKMLQNTVERISSMEIQHSIENYVEIDIPSISLANIQECIENIEVRNQLLEDGIQSAKKFIEKTRNTDKDSKNTHKNNEVFDEHSPIY